MPHLYRARAPGAGKKIDQEVSVSDGSWQGIVPNIDEVHIFTMPEHRARRKEEEKLFRGASREREVILHEKGGSVQ
jgi:hypothetical protein